MNDLMMFLGFDDGRTDVRTDGLTTLVDKSLSRLKIIGGFNRLKPAGRLAGRLKLLTLLWPHKAGD